jgi:hypothetical protein
MPSVFGHSTCLKYDRDASALLDPTEAAEAQWRWSSPSIGRDSGIWPGAIQQRRGLLVKGLRRLLQTQASWGQSLFFFPYQMLFVSCFHRSTINGRTICQHPTLPTLKLLHSSSKRANDQPWEVFGNPRFVAFDLLMVPMVSVGTYVPSARTPTRLCRLSLAASELVTFDRVLVPAGFPKGGVG